VSPWCRPARIVLDVRTQWLVDRSEQVLGYGAPIAVAVGSLLLGQSWNLLVLGLIVAAVARTSRYDVVALVPDGTKVTVSYGYLPVHRVTVEHAPLDIRRARDVILLRGPGLPTAGLSYGRRTRHGLDQLTEALEACDIEVLPAGPDHAVAGAPTGGSWWSRLTRHVTDSAVLSAAAMFVVALAAIGTLHALNGPSDEGMTSSWAEVLGLSAFFGGGTLALGLIDRFQDRARVGPDDR
jgi:hypothetical protein